MTELSAEMLAAILNDDAKAERLTELLAQEKKNTAILVEAQAAREAAADKLLAAGKLVAEAGAIREEADARHRALAESEDGVRSVMATLTQEKDAFNSIRAQVEADLKQRTEALIAAEASVAERETALAHGELEVAENKAAVIRLRATLQAKHERLHAALVADQAEEPQPETAT